MARTHFQGLIRKRLMPATLASPVAPADRLSYVGAKVIAGGTRTLGTIRGACGSHGIVHMRLEETWEALQGGVEMVADVAGVPVRVLPHVPDWWPGDLKPSMLASLFKP